MSSEVGAWQVFLVACTVALFQGLGAVPLWIFDELGLAVSSYLIVMAAGMMVGTGFVLVSSALIFPDHWTDHPWNAFILLFTQGDLTSNLTSFITFVSQQSENGQVVFGFLMGWLILHFCASFIQSLKYKPDESNSKMDPTSELPNVSNDENKNENNSSEDDPLVAWLISSNKDDSKVKLTENMSQMLIVILTMFAHSLGEGASIGVSYAMDNSNSGAHQTVIWSLCIHNIPEGLATCLFLVSRGLNKKQAAIWSVFCDLPLPMTAVPAFIFVDTFAPLLPLSIGFAAGAMAYVSFVELIPECIELINHQDSTMDHIWMSKVKLICIFIISAIAVLFLAD